MSSIEKNLSNYIIDTIPDISSKIFGIITSEWNEAITSVLEKGCLETLTKNGVLKKNIHILRVPGSFELPLGVRMLASKEKLDAVICLGCVIKGETKHDDYINQAVAHGIMQLGLTSGRPVVFGVITSDNMEQAKDRAGGKHGNKGIEAAVTALKMIALADKLKTSQSNIGFGK